MKQQLAVVLALWLVGCDDPLKPVELIQEPRVLGARVEVRDEPARAAPAPGETATVRFLLASPAPAPTQGFALAACPAQAGRGTRSQCATEPFAQVLSADGEADVPALSFEVPAELDADGRVLVLGVICPYGSPSADGRSCDGVEPGSAVTLEFELQRDGDTNLNPALEPQSLLFDDQEWPDLPAAEGECAGLGYAEVDVGSRHSLQVSLDEADRDPLPQPAELDPLRESLQLSHFATGGDLDRAFETIAWDSGELLRKSSWAAPKQAGLVRFWLVLRDFRGGSDFVERAVCVR